MVPLLHLQEKGRVGDDMGLVGGQKSLITVMGKEPLVQKPDLELWSVFLWTTNPAGMSTRGLIDGEYSIQTEMVMVNTLYLG